LLASDLGECWWFQQSIQAMACNVYSPILENGLLNDLRYAQADGAANPDWVDKYRRLEAQVSLLYHRLTPYEVGKVLTRIAPQFVVSAPGISGRLPRTIATIGEFAAEIAERSRSLAPLVPGGAAG
jgi:hypothetical protein